MNKKLVILVLALIELALIGGAASVAHQGANQIRLTESEIQGRVDQAVSNRLAAQQSGVKSDAVVISAAHLKLADNTVAIAVEASATRSRLTLAVDASANGEIRYQSGAFYFLPQSVTIDKLQLNERTVQDNVGRIIDRFALPIERKDELAEHADLWVRGKLQQIAIVQLARHAVYTLPNTLEGLAARIMIKDVRIENSAIVVEWSYATLAICLLVVTSLLAAIGLVVTMKGK